MKTLQSVLRGGFLVFFLIIHQITPAQLIISQYHEGLFNDKFLEITNTGTSTFDGQNQTLFICVFSNEKAINPIGQTPGLSTAITQKINPGGTIVFKNSLATTPVYAVDIAIGALIGAFNGNDIIILSTTKDESAWENRIDVIGEPNDWGTDKSLYRNPTVTHASMTYNASDWVEVNLNTVENADPSTVERLGFHLYNCVLPTTPPIDVIITNIQDYSAKINWSGGDGSNSLVIVKNTPALNVLPSNGENYTASPYFGNGTAWEDGYVVYNGWENEIDINGLSADQNYFVFIFEMSCTPTQYAASYSTGNFTTLMPIPSVYASPETGFDFGVVVPNIPSNSVSIALSWQNLAGPIDLTVNPPFQIKEEGGIWDNSIQIPEQTDGGSNIDIRCIANVAVGNIQDSVLINTPGIQIKVPMTGVTEPNLWVNEFHYEDQAGDDNEFVEVVLENSDNYPLDRLSLVLYNGATGLPYASTTINQMEPGEIRNNYSIFTWYVSNIQNGQPGYADGIALGIDNSLVQFISYEGILTATSGIADQMTSIDIGWSETDEDTLENQSLQLTNLLTGEQQVAASNLNYNDFEWTSGVASPGFFNSDQSLPVEIKTFTVREDDHKALLTWATLTESNNDGFEVQKSLDGLVFREIGFVKGAGFSNALNQYQWTDEEFYESAYYRLKQIDMDGMTAFSKIIQLKTTSTYTDNFLIVPHPVKSSLNLIQLKEKPFNELKIELLSIHGVKILDTTGDLVKIIFQLNQLLQNLQTGFYILKIEGEQIQEKHVFLKL